MKVFYFGSPGNGFESYPTAMVYSVSMFDKSYLGLGELVCRYIKDRDIVKIIYVLYGLGGESDGSYRKGRNFGVGIELNGFEIVKNERKNLFEFLHRFVYQGVNQSSVDIFVPNDGFIKDFKIKSLQERSTILDKLSLTLIRQFEAEFRDSMTKITDESAYTEELDPEKKKSETLATISPRAPGQQVRTELSDSEGEPVTNQESSITSKRSFNWWPLMFIPLLGLSLYNYIQIDETRKQVAKNAVDIGEYNDSKGIKRYSDKSLVRHIKSNGKISQYVYLKDIKVEPNIVFNNSDEYLNYIIGFLHDRSELPDNVSHGEVISFIRDNNEEDLKRIDEQLEETGRDMPITDVLSSLNPKLELLIWQE